jgi:hypothetical protein
MKNSETIITLGNQEFKEIFPGTKYYSYETSGLILNLTTGEFGRIENGQFTNEKPCKYRICTTKGSSYYGDVIQMTTGRHGHFSKGQFIERKFY